MRASDLHSGIWNSIADLVERSRGASEVYFDTVKKRDIVRKLIWTPDFSDIPIPMLAHTYSFVYFDSVATLANLGSGAVASQKIKREDRSHTDPLYLVEVVTPDVGDLVVILDMWGGKSFPVCIGTIQSKPPFWEDA